MSASAASVATTRGSVVVSDMTALLGRISLPPKTGRGKGREWRTRPHHPSMAFSSAGREKAGGRSEESERVGRVADRHVLGLLVVIQHHLVRLAADARLLVAAEVSMRGIGMVAIGPHA